MDSSPKEMTDEEFARYWVEEDKEEEVVVPKYVIATEENEKRSDGKCLLCKERLELKFDQDEEDWIYMGCIIVNQKLVHEECHNIVSG